jgi:hypothetical protein
MKNVQRSELSVERGLFTPNAQRPTLNPVAYARRRFRQWWQARLPLTDTMTLTQRNVYILPTRPGFMLALTLLVLLVGSINYQLNLGYLLTFLLAGCALAGMHVCHATLRGLTLSLMPPPPQFAGASAPLTILLGNSRRAVRYGIGLAVLDASHEDRWAWTDVPPQGTCSVQVAFRPERRGLHRVPPLTAGALPAGHLPGLDGVAAGGAGPGVSGAGTAAPAAAAR